MKSAFSTARQLEAHAISLCLGRPTARQRASLAFRRTAFALAILSLFSGPICSAQIAPQDREHLVQQGFSASDLKAVEITQIAPHYTLFARWLKCVSDAGNTMLMNGVSSDKADRFADGVCQNEAMELRASVARATGLSQASRIIQLLQADLRINLEKDWKLRHPDTVNGVEQVGIWSLAHNGPGVCTIVMLREGVIGPIFIIQHQNQIMLALRTSFPQPGVGAPSPNSISLNRDPAPLLLATQPKVVRMENATWVAADLRPNEIADLERVGSFSVIRVGSGGDETYSVDPTFPQALAALKRCH